MARWKASSENILFQATRTEKNSKPDLIFFYIRMMRVAGGNRSGGEQCCHSGSGVSAEPQYVVKVRWHGKWCSLSKQIQDFIEKKIPFLIERDNLNKQYRRWFDRLTAPVFQQIRNFTEEEFFLMECKWLFFFLFRWVHFIFLYFDLLF